MAHTPGRVSCWKMVSICFAVDVATFGGIPLKQNKQAVLVDRFPTPIRYEQKEVVRRLRRGRCELCEIKDEQCVARHARKLVDLERMGKKRPPWAQIIFEGL